jgi:acyl-CoA synthetase (AMP-forming)/AMP-acid ligase II
MEKVMNLGMYFDRAVQQHRGKVAIVDKETVLTYGELGRRAVRLANVLKGLGLKKGERAAILTPNCHEAVEIDAALFKMGIIKVPLNARVSPREIEAMINDSGASALFVHSSVSSAILDRRDSLKSLRNIIVIEGAIADCLSYEDLVERGTDDGVDADVDVDDVYSLVYTSGTSGVLKAAMLTHRNWICLTRNNLMRTGSDLMEVSVAAYVGPITHAAGGSIIANLVRGATNVLFRQFEPDAFLRSIEEHKITDVLLVPVMINMLLASPEITRTDLSSLRTIVYGAAPTAPERIKSALEIFGPILVQGYGQTETCAVISSLGKADHMCANNPATVHRLASAGQPNFDCEVRLVNDFGEEVPVGEVGEIIVRGDCVMKGYWNAPELTSSTIRDGWLYTRDMGRFDEDGYLYLVDRKSDMIITGGFNVYPTEVENVLCEHPAVHEATVISVPDAKWGEAIKAVVVARPGASVTSDELIQFCRRSLAGYKAPKSIDFVSELPRSAVGKILRRVVREPHWRGHDRRIG